MSAANHTPGIWERVPQSQGGDLIAHRFETGNQMNPMGLRLVCFMVARGNSLKEDEANANLSTAAPDLLDIADAVCKMFALAGVPAIENSNDPTEALHFRAMAARDKAVA